MKKELIAGIIFSKFHTKSGPMAVAWIPSNVSHDVRNLVSMKSINVLVGEKGYVPKSLTIFPFPSINLKGLIKLFEIKDSSARGGAIDSSITVLFNEANDPIYYKHIKNFENYFNEVTVAIRELEESQGDKSQYKEELEKFYSNLIELLNELRESELSFKEEEAFPKEEEPVELEIAKFKVIVVGDPAVGKTSTVLRFTERAFKRSYLPTIGTNISEKAIRIGDRKVEFVIWDIAGQSKFQMMRKHFYAGADGQLLIFDLTRPKTFKNVSDWYQDIKSYLKKNLHGFILGNKSDLVDQREVNKYEIVNLAKELNLDFIETSALSGENVDEAFHKLGKLLSTHK